MSRTKPSDLDQLALELDCGWCDAKPGAWCTTSSGAWATYLHGYRTRVVHSARRQGWREAMKHHDYAVATAFRTHAKALIAEPFNPTVFIEVRTWMLQIADQYDEKARAALS